MSDIKERPKPPNVRHLRAIKQSAEREAGLVEQAIAPFVRRRTHANELLQRIGAAISPDAEVATLSMPEQQLVEIACAVNITGLKHGTEAMNYHVSGFGRGAFLLR